VSREDREALAIAQAELARRRQLWNGRLTDISGSVLVQVFCVPRHQLEALLLAAMFTHAPGINRGEYLRVELEPHLTAEQLAAQARRR
jgi:hypothetical protein